MKHTLRLALLLLLGSAGQAFASGGPDAYGYTWITSADPGGPTFSWVDITSRPGVQTVTGLADDNSAASMVPIGFNFHFYWTDETQLRVGSNGWLSFNSSASNIASCFPTIPTAGGAADKYLAALMSDLNFTGVGNVGQVKYWTNNVDSFIISYINVPYWSVSAPGWTGSNSFQVILCGADSSITYQYGSLSAFTNGASCNDMEVGIENSTGTIGLQVFSDVIPPSNYVVRFDYPAVPLISIQDALPQWNANSGNQSEFLFLNVPATLTSDIRNSGNAAITTNIGLQANVLNLVPSVVYTGAGNIPTMAAGDDSVFTFSTTWTPSATGQYSYQVTTSCSQDVNNGNNINTTEFDVVNPCLATMPLSYVSGNTPGSSINWNGGANDDGVAVYFAPPVTQYTLSAVQFYISSNVGNGYIATIYDDDGPNGAPGTVLFTTTVASGSVISGAWNTVSVSPAVTIPSGGFYVAWFQGGTNIFIGSETAGPFSHRNYEILDGSWASLRYNDVQDVCIRTSITGYQGTPTANYTSSLISPLSYSFSNTTTGLATSWSWDFGDSNTSTQQNPSHTYAAAGTYNVCLIATSSCGADTICQQLTVCAVPVAAYSSSTSAGTVNFTDMTTNNPTSWSWDFGDSNTSTQQNPSHTYTADGTYTVCLIANTGCGADTVCQSVTVCIPPSASYSSATNGSSVDFTDMSSGAVTSWSWDFGDGNTSTQQNPTHTYAADGTYNVCLVSATACASDTDCQQVTVCVPTVAAFSDSANFGTVTFIDLSTGGPLSWAWDFGDGSPVDTTQNPVHNYTTSGTYNVCLITGDGCGSDTTCTMINVVITGIAETHSGISAVYPNPASDVLSVQFSHTISNGSLEVFDQLGRVLQSENKLNGTTTTLSIGSLPPGIYLLRLRDGDHTSNITFVKQ